MPKKIYNDLRGVVSKVLADFGQGEIAYVAVAAGTGTGDNPGPSIRTVHPFNGVARGVSFKYVNGTSIVATDLQVTMPADGVTPQMNGFVRIDGTDHKIAAIMHKPAAGAPVAYLLIVKR